MEHELTYRRATEPDLALLADLNAQLLEDERARTALSRLELEQRLRDLLAGEYQAIFFSHGGRVVAYALFCDYSDRIYLRHFFVVRDARRQGIGRQAIAILRQHIWPRERRLTVEALYDNAPAIAFWQAVGFLPYTVAFEILPEV